MLGAIRIGLVAVPNDVTGQQDIASLQPRSHAKGVPEIVEAMSFRAELCHDFLSAC